MPNERIDAWLKRWLRLAVRCIHGIATTWDTMNVMWYVGKFDEATWHLIASLGLPAERLRQDGIVMAAVEQRIEYKRELRAGDLITVRSSVQEVGDKTVVMVHEMTNQGTGELAARTVIKGICVDASTRRARSLPDDVRERAAEIASGKGAE